MIDSRIRYFLDLSPLSYPVLEKPEKVFNLEGAGSQVFFFRHKIDRILPKKEDNSGIHKKK